MLHCFNLNKQFGQFQNSEFCKCNITNFYYLSKLSSLIKWTKLSPFQLKQNLEPVNVHHKNDTHQENECMSQNIFQQLFHTDSIKGCACHMVHKSKIMSTTVLTHCDRFLPPVSKSQQLKTSHYICILCKHTT